MKRIEYFCRSIRHDDPIEEQMEEAKRGGIIKSYTLTTLSAMNARRNADICLWCDEIWSADHIHSCLCVPDHNCMFTCGIDFEVFAFVKVSKEGLKHVVVNDSQGEALVHCAEKVFEEMCDTNLCISSKEALISSAPQVFDELTQPVLGTNPGQIIEENQDNNALISNFDNSNEIQGDEECTYGHGNEGTQADGISLSLNRHLVEEVYEFRGETDSGFIEEIQQPNAYKMLDELPLPTFLKEMAEASRATEVESIQGDYELEPAIQEVQGDHFTHKELCAKLCTLEGSHLRDLVIIYTNRMRFSTILGSLLNGCQLSDKIPHKVDDSYGNSFFECPCFEVSAKSFVMLNADHSPKFIENVVLPLLLSDIDWFIGSSISMILGVNVYKPKVVELEHTGRSRSNFKGVYKWDKHLICRDYGRVKLTLLPLNFGHPCTMNLIFMRCWYMFSNTCGSGPVGVTLVNGILIPILHPNVDLCTTWISIPYDPGILVVNLSPFVFTYTLEDKGAFRDDEGISRKQTWFLLNPLVIWSNFNASRVRKSVVFPTRVFDPGGLWDVLLHSSWCSNPNLGFCMNYLSACVLDELGNCNTWLPLLSSMSCSRNMAMINAFSLGHEMVLKIRIILLLNGSSFHLLKENLKVSIKCLMKKEVVTVFIFDPGINKSRIVEKRSVIVRCSVGVAPNLVLVYAEIFIWPKIYSSRQSYGAVRCNFFSRAVFVIEKRAYTIEETKEVMSKDRFLADTTGGRSIEHVTNFCRSSLYECAFMDGNPSKLLVNNNRMQWRPSQKLVSSKKFDFETVWVFDPGGNENFFKGKSWRTKMITRVQTSQYGGGKQLINKCNGDRQIYVFDPGGYDIAIMLQTRYLESIV